MKKESNSILLKDSPKATSWSYGEEHQLSQAEKYRNRDSNHWRVRIDLAQRLAREYSMPRLAGKGAGEIIVVDAGCGIGTFAIEFAKAGYRSYGIDFDTSALDLARQLCREENTHAEFICGDISNWTDKFPDIDIAVCFDIFEHLHDDELGALLVSIRKNLSNKGSLVFHTFPTEYDYIFYTGGRFIPLVPFKFLSCNTFQKIARAYAVLGDMACLLYSGKTYKEKIMMSGHCNLTSERRLINILQRAGYEILHIQSAQLYPMMHAKRQRLFAKHPVSYRNIYGVAVPKS